MRFSDDKIGRVPSEVCVQTQPSRLGIFSTSRKPGEERLEAGPGTWLESLEAQSLIVKSGEVRGAQMSGRNKH